LQKPTCQSEAEIFCAQSNRELSLVNIQSRISNAREFSTQVANIWDKKFEIVEK